MWRIFLSLLSISGITALLSDFVISNYGSSLTHSVTDILMNCFVNNTSTVNIYFPSANKSENLQLAYDVNEILSNVRREMIIVQLEDFASIKRLNRKSSHHVIFCDTYESFEIFFKKMDPMCFDYQGIYLIILTTYRDDLYELMTNIFESLWIQLIVNVNIVWMPMESETLVYTFYPYTSFYCGKAVPIQLNQFRFGKWLKETDFFPNKMKNLHGCTLRVATFTNAPFMMIQKHADGRVEVDGIDGILLRVLSQEMNFNTELLLVEDVKWGSIFKNGTATGQ